MLAQLARNGKDFIAERITETTKYAPAQRIAIHGVDVAPVLAVNHTRNASHFSRQHRFDRPPVTGVDNVRPFPPEKTSEITYKRSGLFAIAFQADQTNVGGELARRHRCNRADGVLEAVGIQS